VSSYRNNEQDATVYQNLFYVYMTLNMFQATHRSSSGAKELHLQPLVLHTFEVVRRWFCWTRQRPAKSTSNNLKRM